MMIDDLLFQKAFKAIIGVEGGLSTRSDDPGNWTGGRIGSGRLVGTKYGIAASSHPNVDIVNLTLPEAETIYYNEYWLEAHCPQLTGSLSPLALMLFDGAVNSGPKTSVKWLQAAVGAAQDGVIGTRTIEAIKAKGAAETLIEVTAQRILFMTTLGNWPQAKLGWLRRVARIQLACTSFTLSSAPERVPTVTVTNGEVTLAAIENIVIESLRNYVLTEKG